MTTSDKREFMRSTALNQIKAMLPDIGAQRALAILESGSDAEIESNFECGFRQLYEREKSSLTRI